jgi:hypothetical protein
MENGTLEVEYLGTKFSTELEKCGVTVKSFNSFIERLCAVLGYYHCKHFNDGCIQCTSEFDEAAVERMLSRSDTSNWTKHSSRKYKIFGNIDVLHWEWNGIHPCPLCPIDNKYPFHGAKDDSPLSSFSYGSSDFIFIRGEDSLIMGGLLLHEMAVHSFNESESSAYHVNLEKFVKFFDIKDIDYTPQYTHETYWKNIMTYEYLGPDEAETKKAIIKSLKTNSETMVVNNNIYQYNVDFLHVSYRDIDKEQECITISGIMYKSLVMRINDTFAPRKYHDIFSKDMEKEIKESYFIKAVARRLTSL